MAATKMMRAVQLATAGPASNLELVDLPIPIPNAGQVLIRVKAFGLNRSEILTRKFGRAPIGPVTLPRVLGIEAVGVVESAPGRENEFPTGSIAFTAIGGMVIAFDGSYAQYTVVAAENVRIVDAEAEKLGWETLGALPEMLQTAHGCLFRSLKLRRGESILIRGGTTSIGLAAAALAKSAGATVIATTRRNDQKTAQVLRDNGADHVLVDDGTSLRSTLLQSFPAGVNKVLELIGGAILPDSISCLIEDGICCFTGLVGGSHLVSEFNPLAMIQTERYLTAYGERSFKAGNFPLNELVKEMLDGTLKVRVGAVFNMDNIVEAHECMEKNESLGKIVVLTGM